MFRILYLYILEISIYTQVRLSVDLFYYLNQSFEVDIDRKYCPIQFVLIYYSNLINITSVRCEKFYALLLIKQLTRTKKVVSAHINARINEC